MPSGERAARPHRPIGGTFQKRVERGKGTRSPYPDGDDVPDSDDQNPFPC